MITHFIVNIFYAGALLHRALTCLSSESSVKDFSTKGGDNVLLSLLKYGKSTHKKSIFGLIANCAHLSADYRKSVSSCKVVGAIL